MSAGHGIARRDLLRTVNNSDGIAAPCAWNRGQWLVFSRLGRGDVLETIEQTCRRRTPIRSRQATRSELYNGETLLVVQHVRAGRMDDYAEAELPFGWRKIFDSYSRPAEWKDELQAKLGVFPLLKFWGPGTDISSTRWIVDAALDALKSKRPTLSLVYLPHLDYNFQRFGPADPRCRQDLREVDAEAGRLISAACSSGAEVVVLSEYAITKVDRPVHLNRVLREHGYLSVRKELPGWETLDCGASRAFAVADHQLAHVYVTQESDLRPVAELLRKTPGVEIVLDRQPSVNSVSTILAAATWSW